MRHVDIVPTVLALLGLPGGDTMQGANLLPALEGRVAPLDLPQYSEARLAEEGFGMAPLSGVRHAGRKWIRAPRPELYDLHDDPRELENLYPSAPAVARPLQVDEELVLADSARHAITARPREIDHETEEMLRSGTSRRQRSARAWPAAIRRMGWCSMPSSRRLDSWRRTGGGTPPRRCS